MVDKQNPGLRRILSRFISDEKKNINIYFFLLKPIDLFVSDSLKSNSNLVFKLLKANA